MVPKGREFIGRNGPQRPLTLMIVRGKPEVNEPVRERMILPKESQIPASFRLTPSGNIL